MAGDFLDPLAVEQRDLAPAARDELALLERLQGLSDAGAPDGHHQRKEFVRQVQHVGRVSRRRNPPVRSPGVGGLRFANPPYALHRFRNPTDIRAVS